MNKRRHKKINVAAIIMQRLFLPTAQLTITHLAIRLGSAHTVRTVTKFTRTPRSKRFLL